MTGIIIQARMGAKRLPGKVLKKISGKTMLEWVIFRAQKISLVDKVIVATTENKSDDAIVSLCNRLGTPVFRGSEKDVLDRYYQAAKKFSLDVIVRITADCPLIDPKIIGDVIAFYNANHKKYDLVGNVYPPTFPDGMDVEIMPFRTLNTVWKEAKSSHDREHVTLYMRNRPRKFRTGNFPYHEDISRVRLTVDNKEDLLLVRKLFSILIKNNSVFDLKDILLVLEKKPELLMLNKHIPPHEGYARYLKFNAKTIN